MNLSSSSKLTSEKVIAVVKLGICFFILFTSWGLTQSFLTSMFGGVGFSSLGLIYLCFCFGSLTSPFVIAYFGLRVSMVSGASTYIIFTISTALGNYWMIIGSSILLGLGGSLLWISQGVYVTVVASGESIGTYNGIFQLIFNLCIIISNLIAGLLLSSSVKLLTLSSLPWILAAIASFGTILFIFLSSVHSDIQSSQANLILKVLPIIKEMFLTAKEPPMLCLMIPIFYQGWSLAFLNGIIPTLLAPELIPFVFLAYGTTRAAGSIFWGRIFDLFSWKPLVFSQLSVSLLAYTASIFAVLQTSWCTFLFGLGIGLSDSCLTVLLTSTIMILYPEKPTPAFSVYRSISSLASSIGFLCSVSIGFPTLIAISILFTVLSSGICSFLYLKITPNTKKIFIEQRNLSDDLSENLLITRLSISDENNGDGAIKTSNPESISIGTVADD